MEHNCGKGPWKKAEIGIYLEDNGRVTRESLWVDSKDRRRQGLKIVKVGGDIKNRRHPFHIHMVLGNRIIYGLKIFFFTKK